MERQLKVIESQRLFDDFSVCSGLKILNEGATKITNNNIFFLIFEVNLEYVVYYIEGIV